MPLAGGTEMENRFIDLMSPDKSFRVSYVKDKLSNNQSNNQFHDYLELFYQLSGERHYFIKDQVFNIHKGDLVLINELELHRTTASRTPTYSRVLIHFRKSFLTNFLEMIRDIDLKPLMTESYHVTTVPLKEQAYVDNLFFSIIDEDATTRPGYESRIKLLLLDLFVYISRSAEKHKGQNLPYYSPIQEKILKAAQFISSHYSEKLTLDELASRFSVSRYYFCRTFKEITGFCLVEYINSIRIKEAQRLLLKTNRPIIDIALQVGFQNPTHFSRIFRALLRYSPSEYRKRAQASGSPVAARAMEPAR